MGCYNYTCYYNSHINMQNMILLDPEIFCLIFSIIIYSTYTIAPSFSKTLWEALFSKSTKSLYPNHIWEWMLKTLEREIAVFAALARWCTLIPILSSYAIIQLGPTPILTGRSLAWWRRIQYSGLDLQKGCGLQ